ncbi:crotonase/enoyl-CoA hydratase family protein [Bradyrhizobium sp. Ai1a-2]|uniref:crotonase/enoyl-CoA hydratase family protein n=1 Tax=Bradyrhizobium sp. Ai1a-2 TaxID=196490 RepID=UPI0004883AD4|nr:crotonase/enoyl-CoA hydratase family protein [Bradyrhizobium sp. Ai1a-2]
MTYPTQFDLPRSLSVDLHGNVAVLCLSRQDKRNALDAETIRGIDRFFSDLPSSIQAVVIHGRGDHFCAGADLAMIADISGSSTLLGSQEYHRAFDRVERSRVPVIAVLHGAVVGGGLELAAAAHIRVAERGAFYALPEGTRGIFVGGAGSVRIPRLIGVPRMMDMILTGRTYGAEAGEAIGLSQYLVESGEGLTKGLELAKRAAANLPVTNFAIIRALPLIARANPEAGSLLESLMFTATAAEEEAKRRLRAFLDKKAPKVSYSA